MQEFKFLPENVQVLRKSIYGCCDTASREVRTGGDKATASQQACYHLASWTILNTDAAIFLAGTTTYLLPSVSLLRACMESQARANYIANLSPPERERKASEFLSITEFAKARECECLLNDVMRLAQMKAAAPPKYPLEDNCRKIISSARAKLSAKETIKQRLKTLESYWGFGNMQKLLKNMPANKQLQAAVGNVESYWVSA